MDLKAVPPPSSYESYSELVATRERIYGDEFRVLRDLNHEPIGQQNIKLESNEYRDIGELFGAVNENPTFAASNCYSVKSSAIVDGQYTMTAPMFPSRTHRYYSQHTIQIDQIPSVCYGCFGVNCICKRVEDFDLSAFKPTNL